MHVAAASFVKSNHAAAAAWAVSAHDLTCSMQGRQRNWGKWDCPSDSKLVLDQIKHILKLQSQP